MGEMIREITSLLLSYIFGLFMCKHFNVILNIRTVFSTVVFCAYNYIKFLKSLFLFAKISFRLFFRKFLFLSRYLHKNTSKGTKKIIGEISKPYHVGHNITF